MNTNIMVLILGIIVVAIACLLFKVGWVKANPINNSVSATKKLLFLFIPTLLLGAIWWLLVGTTFGIAIGAAIGLIISNSIVKPFPNKRE
ncbi:hypothetical protein [Massilia sp. PWRC2]|uniref:hypothetical protein n=1 Tax=Massilia sp. PWRC2 TaxID=2804626 RepID=UPI003CF1848D